MQYKHTRRDDVITVPSELVKRYDADPNWKRVASSTKTTAKKSAPAKKAAKKIAPSNSSTE